MPTAVSGSPRPGTRVHVDQVGYLPSAEKLAVTTVEATRFAVVDAARGDVVHAGSLSDPIDDPDAGETVRWASFTPLSTNGTYRVTVGTGENSDGGLTETLARSPPFRIEADVYDETLADCVRLYSLKRSNTAIDDPRTGLSVPAGHTQDTRARLFYSHDVRAEGETLDVAGGWYDAGDYGKYVPTGAVTVGHLLLVYEQFPDAFEPGQCDLPSGRSPVDRDAGLPDLLVEAKFELEWLERMQRPDGAVYHKVAAAEWPDLDEAPSDDDRDRYVYGCSTFGTAQYAAAMAMAARVYDPFNHEFAKRALANAREAFEYLGATPDPEFRFDQGQDDGSGPYRKETDAEERFWATAELLKTTGETRYADHLESAHANLFDAPVRAPVWSDTLSLGQWAYVSATAGRPERQRTLESAFLEYADDLVAAVEADGYRDALDTEDYHWASTKLALSKAACSSWRTTSNPTTDTSDARSTSCTTRSAERRPATAT